MSNNRFNTIEDLNLFSLRTRYHVDKNIKKLYDERKTLPDVSNIEQFDFTEEKSNFLAEKLLKHFNEFPELTNHDANGYVYRLRELVVSLKTFVLSREAFANFEIVKQVVNNIYFKNKAYKIQACEAILFYLKKVGADNIEPYELLLEESKVIKKHPPKVKNI